MAFGYDDAIMLAGSALSSGKGGGGGQTTGPSQVGPFGGGFQQQTPQQFLPQQQPPVGFNSTNPYGPSQSNAFASPSPSKGKGGFTTGAGRG